MRNAKSLLGMPVIRGSRNLGRVAHVLMDDQLTFIRGLYLSCGLIGSRFIECAQLDVIGEAAILASGCGKRMQMNERTLLRRAFSPDGRRIGAITDAVIDEKTLVIEALELCRGYLDDLTGGRPRIRQFTVQKNGDVVVESSEGGNLP